MTPRIEQSVTVENKSAETQLLNQITSNFSKVPANDIQKFSVTYEKLQSNDLSEADQPKTLEPAFQPQ